MAIPAHSQHDGIERQRQPAKTVRNRLQRHAGHRSRRIQPDQLDCPGLSGQQALLQQVLVACRVRDRQPALIRQRHGHARPVDLAGSQPVENRSGRRSAGNCKACFAAGFQADADFAGQSLRNDRGESLGIGMTMQRDRCASHISALHWLGGRRYCRPVQSSPVQSSSCQVRPSRSIRAIAADGPQAPAV